MKDLIQNVASGLGVSEQVAESATSGLLGSLKAEAPAGDFSQLLSKLPGAEQLLNAQPEASAASAGGLLGGVASAAGLGSGVGGLASALGGSGLEAGQYGAFASMFLGYVKEKAGSELVSKLAESVPFLKQFTS